MTIEPLKTPPVHREKARVQPKAITVRPEFVARKGAQDRAHVRTIAQAVRNHGALDPALLLAAGANAKDKASLTRQEKAGLAWRLVREPGMNFSKPEIARATGVSTATVGRMRARWRVLEKAA